MRAIAIAIAAIVDDDASPRPDPRLPHPAPRPHCTRLACFTVLFPACAALVMCSSCSGSEVELAFQPYSKLALAGRGCDLLCMRCGGWRSVFVLFLSAGGSLGSLWEVKKKSNFWLLLMTLLGYRTWLVELKDAGERDEDLICLWDGRFRALELVSFFFKKRTIDSALLRSVKWSPLFFDLHFVSCTLCRGGPGFFWPKVTWIRSDKVMSSCVMIETSRDHLLGVWGSSWLDRAGCLLKILNRFASRWCQDWWCAGALGMLLKLMSSSQLS